jgi:hypothetical protein
LKLILSLLFTASLLCSVTTPPELAIVVSTSIALSNVLLWPSGSSNVVLTLLYENVQVKSDEQVTGS